ncbi:transcriptional regulator [Chryseobacterium sp. GP-SGM7]|uniref:transcriptional regulator n=1 Tax=Chryseobacterium sp. GP-SGM7 TaxID=3411323 RepID=UPI003B95DA23
MKDGKIVEIIISEIDLYVIDKVREYRGKNIPYISQVELSQRMGYADGYVGKVENYSSNTRYNIRKLNLLAKALGLNSSREILPNNILQNDLLFLKLKVNTRKNDTVEFDSMGNVIKNYEIIEQKILNEEELKQFNNRRAKKS